MKNDLKFKLSLPAEKKYLAYALDFLENLTMDSGLDDKDAMKMRLAVEESSLNVIEHAFDPDEEGEFDLTFYRKPGKIVIEVADKGLPVDFTKIQEDQKVGIGIKLIRGLTDEVRFNNLGRDGKSVELIKYIKYKDIAETLTEEEKQQEKQLSESPIASQSVDIKMMNADECSRMSRCVYRSYGYSYIIDTIYYPEKVRENLETGHIKSVISVDSTGEIVGHMALIFDFPGAKVGETGQAVVDPRYRGHSLFKRMKQALIDYAKETGMYGVYSEAVTAHPFTQKGNIRLGATETGFLLCYVPGTVKFKKIENNEQESIPQSAVLFYLRTNEEPHRVSYPPARHKDWIKRIYDRAGLNRTIEESEPVEITNKTTISTINVVESALRAFVNIIDYGKDFEPMIKHRLKELLQRKMEIIYIDLPLSNPNTAYLYEVLENLGLFFVGLIPEKNNGDIIRFEYLNNVQVDPDYYHRVSDFTKEFFDYMMKEKERVS
jgi:anti-sigma regulatory factor (Ser/Thr protein kinase)/GNAT superfamily N-acetyltransferase